MATHANNSADHISMVMSAPGRPEDTVTVTITATEAFATTDPVDVAVLMFWKCFEVDNQQPTAESVWRHMASRGMRDDGSQPIRQKTVQDAVDRLVQQGLLPAPQDGAQ